MKSRNGARNVYEKIRHQANVYSFLSSAILAATVPTRPTVGFEI